MTIPHRQRMTASWKSENHLSGNFTLGMAKSCRHKLDKRSKARADATSTARKERHRRSSARPGAVTFLVASMLQDEMPVTG